MMFSTFVRSIEDEFLKAAMKEVLCAPLLSVPLADSLLIIRSSQTSHEAKASVIQSFLQMALLQVVVHHGFDAPSRLFLSPSSRSSRRKHLTS
jgi:hypothetical protein